METIRFESHGDSCEAWWLAAGSDALTTAAGAPCVVMGHGFGCTRDCGLLPFAERFAAIGCGVLVFDYRGFGGSGGTPRQDVDHRRHREDYHAAIDVVRGRDGVDPDRVVAWGTSYSGGHVVAVAAQDHRLAAVVSQGAAMDGWAALTGKGRPADPDKAPGGQKGRALAVAVARDLVRAATRRAPYRIPFMGPAGSGALISGNGAVEFGSITGPTFRNQMCARGLLRIGLNRPLTVSARVTCPTLLVIAEQDEIAPAATVHEVARRIPRSETLSFECRHFSLYSGAVFEDSVAAQTAFLERVLAADTAQPLDLRPRG